MIKNLTTDDKGYLVNKRKLIEIISEETSTTQNDCALVIEEMMKLTQEVVKKGGVVRISGFGTFSRMKRQGRTARNPRTGEKIRTKSRWVPKFKSSKQLNQVLTDTHSG